MASRRAFIQDLTKASLGGAAMLHWQPGLLDTIRHNRQLTLHRTPQEVARDEAYWKPVQQAYTVSPNIINLNNGGVSPQPRTVQDAEDRYNRTANEGPAYYMWRILDKGRPAVKRQLAQMAGCLPEEVAILRNATEALENLLFGLPLKAGDEVLTTDQDYPSMLSTLDQRARREGIVVKKLSLPVPLSQPEDLVEQYRKAITGNTRLILVCHMINLSGQILPVKDICQLGRQFGIPVVVDGAHTFAHFPFTMDELGCDYFGTSLHKWLSAPFGTGMLYVRKAKIPEVWPSFGSAEEEWDTITKFEHIGTRSLPAEQAIGHAIALQEAIGSERKAARLQYLTDYWVGQVRDIPGIRFNTAFDGGQYGAIANVAIEGKTPQEVQRELFRSYQIYTVAIDHPSIKGVRISPHVYTTLTQLDTLVQALRTIAT